MNPTSTPRTGARRSARVASLALLAGATTLGLCAPSAHAAAPGVQHTAVHKTAARKTKPITETQADQLALQILQDHMKAGSVILSRSTGDHSVSLGFDDAADQHGAYAIANWTLKGSAPEGCTPDNGLCSSAPLGTGTLYTYWLLDEGYTYTYVRADGAAITLDDGSGSWDALGNTGWWPIAEDQVPALMQDARWDQILNAVPDKHAPRPPKPVKPAKGSKLALQMLEEHLPAEAVVASRTTTPTSARITTTGGVETGAYADISWTTQGTGPDQYDRRRDCVARQPDYGYGPDDPNADSSFGTGRLCVPDDPHATDRNWWYVRGDGKVLHLLLHAGLYNGRSAGWHPFKDDAIDAFLLDSRWESILTTGATRHGKG